MHHKTILKTKSGKNREKKITDSVAVKGQIISYAIVNAFLWNHLMHASIQKNNLLFAGMFKE